MASSSPPPDAISLRVLPPKTRSSMDGPFSPSTSSGSFSSLEQALGLLEQVRDAGLVFAPAMPEPGAIKKAATQAGISPKEALKVYLTIVEYDA